MKFSEMSFGRKLGMYLAGFIFFNLFLIVGLTLYLSEKREPFEQISNSFLDNVVNTNRYSKENLKKTIERTTRELQQNKNNVNALSERAEAYMMNEDFVRSVSDYEALHALQPQEEAWLRNIYQYGGHFPEKRKSALDALAELIKRNPESTEYYTARAEINAEDDRDAALADLQTTRKFKLSQSDYLLRAKAYITLELFKEADEDLQKACGGEYNEEMREALDEARDFYIRRGRYDKALQMVSRLNRELEKIPRDEGEPSQASASDLYKEGNLYQVLGRRKEAVSCYKRAYKWITEENDRAVQTGMTGDEIDNYSSELELAALCGEPGAPLKSGARVVRDMPRLFDRVTSDSIYPISLYDISQNLPDKFKGDFRKRALSLIGKYSDSERRDEDWVRLLLQDGRKEEARRVFDRVKKNLGHGECIELAYLLGDDSEFEKQRAEQEKDDHVESCFSLAEVAALKGDRETLAKFIPEPSETLEAQHYYSLYVIENARNDRVKAADYLKKACALGDYKAVLELAR